MDVSVKLKTVMVFFGSILVIGFVYNLFDQWNSVGQISWSEQPWRWLIFAFFLFSPVFLTKTGKS